MSGLRIAFFGSSLVSAYWNRAATYYRGILKALCERGHRISFYEPDVFDRQRHRDIPDPSWAEVVVYSGTEESDVVRVLEQASSSDLIVKASGVGAWDEVLEREIPRLRRADNRVAFWDVDAPATLARMEADPDDSFRSQVGRFDAIFTYGGGAPVVDAYARRGARACIPIYNAHDPSTHRPAPPEPCFVADLSFLGNRLPDREARVEEFFLGPARMLPSRHFLIGGSGWDTSALPANVRHVGHVYTASHNAFNCSPLAVLNVARDSMAEVGFSPATRIFEAAGAGACIITDYWLGVEQFLEPECEILIAGDGDEVARHLRELTPERASAIGRAARGRALRDHTYTSRAREVDLALRELGLTAAAP